MYKFWWTDTDVLILHIYEVLAFIPVRIIFVDSGKATSYETVVMVHNLPTNRKRGTQKKIVNIPPI